MVGIGDVNIIAEGFVMGFRRIVEDDELFDAGSKKLFDRLAHHTVDGGTRWIGAKLLAALGAAMFTAGLWLVLRFGVRP